MVEAENKNIDQAIYFQDYSIATNLELKDKETANIPITLNKQTKTVSVLVNNSNKAFEIFQINKRGKKTPLYKGAENFIVIPAKQLKKAKNLEVNTNGNKDFKIYEVIQN